MTTAYTHRYFILIGIGKTAAANAYAADWDPDSRGDLTFGAVRLSANGIEPATHTACNTVATPEMEAKFLAARSQIPAAAYRIYKEAGGWTWETALADAGLQVIQGNV